MQPLGDKARQHYTAKEGKLCKCTQYAVLHFCNI